MTCRQLKDLDEARQEAMRATKAKSEFLSNMSHDIRTPMNAIVGMTAIARAHIDDMDQVQNCLKKISISGKHLLGLINDMLDMSKIESGKMTLTVERVSLQEVDMHLPAWKMLVIDDDETLCRTAVDTLASIGVQADWTMSGFIAKPLFKSTLYYGLRKFMGITDEQEEIGAGIDLSGRLVLVAEDNEINWEILKELLSDVGMELEWAENGKICLEKFSRSESGRYDAILMDVRMPVMNGYEATEAIRALEREDAKNIPIIAMTADAFSEDIQNLARMCYMEYECETGRPYYDLMKLLERKTYHIMTTNQDFQFTRAVPEENLSAIQGDSRYFQCRWRCHDEIFYNKDMVYRMNAAIDEQLQIPTEMIPRCPKCGAELEPWVRGYTFLEGAKYKDEYRKINEFLQQHKKKKMLFLELGVGRMTPMFIQEPFWNLTYQLPQAFYITINPKDALLPKELADKGLAIKADIAQVLKKAVEMAEAKGWKGDKDNGAII